MLGSSLAKFLAPPLLNPRVTSLSSFYLINQQHVTQLMIHPSRNIFSFWLFTLFLFQLLLLRLLVTLHPNLEHWSCTASLHMLTPKGSPPGYCIRYSVFAGHLQVHVFSLHLVPELQICTPMGYMQVITKRLYLHI